MWKNIRKNLLYPCYKTNTPPKLGKEIFNINKTVIAPDGTTFEDKLNELFAKRMSLSSNKINVIANKTLQPLLNQDKIFYLEKQGAYYHIRKLSDHSLSCPHGYYIFVIPFDEPDKVLCAVLTPGGPNNMHRQEREGHTSFKGNMAVQYAGIMKFINGKLIFWNNASGHFRPSITAHYNFLPHIQLLLPESLFYAYRPYLTTQIL